MIRAVARVAVIVIVPLAGLAALWVQSEHASRQGTDWEVPIEGYDPRDLLRGHYVEFRYDWPIRAPDRREESRGAFDVPQINHLCLIGDPPVIAQARVFDDPSDPLFEQCEHKLSVQPGSVYGYASLVRGRLYVGQERARVLQEGLQATGGDEAQPRAVVTFRQRPDGVLTPLDIRFLPMTEGEEPARNRTAESGAEGANSGAE